MTLAVDRAVITFNEEMEIGLPKLLTELGLEEGPCLKKAYFSTTDRVRINNSERMANAVANKW